MGFCLTSIEIKRLVAGTLPEGAAGRAREHMEDCARCRQQFEALSRSPTPAPEPEEAPGEAPEGPKAAEPEEPEPVSGAEEPAREPEEADTPREEVSAASTESPEAEPEDDEAAEAREPDEDRGPEPGQREPAKEEPAQGDPDDTEPGAGTPARFVPAGYEWLEEPPEPGTEGTHPAVSRTTGRPARVRMLVRSSLGGEEGERRFLLKAAEIARLRHPHIVPVQGAGILEETAWLAQDPPPAQNLEEWLHAGRPSPDESLVAFSKIAAALGRAHEKGLVHGALAPSRILMDSGGEPLVGGWLVRGPSGPSASPDPYAAPEVSLGGPDTADTRSDVYSLGALLYLLLAGRPPVRVAEEASETMRRIHDEVPPPPSAGRTGVGPDLDAVVLRALDKDPVRRYGSAGELAREVDRCRRGEAVDARRDDPWYGLRKALARALFPRRDDPE